MRVIYDCFCQNMTGEHLDTSCESRQVRRVQRWVGATLTPATEGVPIITVPKKDIW